MSPTSEGRERLMTVDRFMSFGEREAAIGDFIPGRERNFGEIAEETSFGEEFAGSDMFGSGWCAVYRRCIYI